MRRDKVIQSIRRDYKKWTKNNASVRLLMRQALPGYKLQRLALRDGLLDDPKLDFDALLIAAENDPNVDAVLSDMASILLYKLAETDPPPLKWFPKELAISSTATISSPCSRANCTRLSPERN